MRAPCCSYGLLCRGVCRDAGGAVRRPCGWRLPCARDDVRCVWAGGAQDQPRLPPTVRLRSCRERGGVCGGGARSCLHGIGRPYGIGRGCLHCSRHPCPCTCRLERHQARPAAYWPASPRLIRVAIRASQPSRMLPCLRLPACRLPSRPSRPWTLRTPCPQRRTPPPSRATPAAFARGARADRAGRRQDGRACCLRPWRGALTRVDHGMAGPAGGAGAPTRRTSSSTPPCATPSPPHSHRQAPRQAGRLAPWVGDLVLHVEQARVSYQ